MSLFYRVLVDAPFVREVWEMVRVSGVNVVSLVVVVDFLGPGFCVHLVEVRLEWESVK